MARFCRRCGSQRTYWKQKLMHPRGYVWLVRCTDCGHEYEDA